MGDDDNASTRTQQSHVTKLEGPVLDLNHNRDASVDPAQCHPGSRLSEDLRGVIIHMTVSRGLSLKSISYFTGIPLRTIQRVPDRLEAHG